MGRAWCRRSGVANDVPDADFVGMPRLTPEMLARLQGFPDSWDFGKRKTIACRMIGNAFPPPVAMKIGLQIKRYWIMNALIAEARKISQRAAI